MEQFKQYGHISVREDGSFHFIHIYGNPSIVSFCSSEKQPVYELTFEEHQNQDINAEPQEYWGWQEDNTMSMIYPKYFLLDMCFPAGIKHTQETGQGRAVKLNLINFRDKY